VCVWRERVLCIPLGIRVHGSGGCSLGKVKMRFWCLEFATEFIYSMNRRRKGKVQFSLFYFLSRWLKPLHNDVCTNFYCGLIFILEYFDELSPRSNLVWSNLSFDTFPRVLLYYAVACDGYYKKLVLSTGKVWVSYHHHHHLPFWSVYFHFILWRLSLWYHLDTNLLKEKVLYSLCNICRRESKHTLSLWRREFLEARIVTDLNTHTQGIV